MRSQLVLLLIFAASFVSICNANPKHKKKHPKKHARKQEAGEQQPRLLRRLAKLAPHRVARYLAEDYADYDDSKNRASDDSFVEDQAFRFKPSRTTFLVTPTEYENAANKITKYLKPGLRLDGEAQNEGLDSTLDMAKDNLHDLQKEMADITHMVKTNPGPGNEVRELNHEQRMKEATATHTELNGMIQQLEDSRRELLSAVNKLNQERAKSEHSREHGALQPKLVTTENKVEKGGCPFGGGGCADETKEAKAEEKKEEVKAEEKKEEAAEVKAEEKKEETAGEKAEEKKEAKEEQAKETI